jgi:hypothetical protein
MQYLKSLIFIAEEDTIFRSNSFYFLGIIPSNGFDSPSFPGNLRDVFYVKDPNYGTPGTYTRAKGGTTWTKQ